MRQHLISCPGCGIKLRFNADAGKIALTCPKCGQRIPISVPRQQDEIGELVAASNEKSNDFAPAGPVSPAKHSRVNLTLLLSCLLVVVPIGIIAGCLYFAYNAISSPKISSNLPTRDTSTLERALLGHWVHKSGSADYFSPDGTLTRVSSGGSAQRVKWTVISQDPARRNIEFTVSDSRGKPHNYTFSEDYRTVESLVAFGAIQTHVPYTFVDTRQYPNEAEQNPNPQKSVTNFEDSLSQLEQSLEAGDQHAIAMEKITGKDSQELAQILKQYREGMQEYAPAKILRSLANEPVDPKKRSEVMEIAEKYLDNEEYKAMGPYAADIVVKWATVDHVEQLKKVAVMNKAYNGQGIAITRLLEMNRSEFYPKIIDLLKGSPGTNVRQHLTSAGPKVEDSILDAFEKNNFEENRDSGFDQTLQSILSVIGTEKSVERLTVIAEKAIDRSLKKYCKMIIEDIEERIENP